MGWPGGSRTGSILHRLLRGLQEWHCLGVCHCAELSAAQLQAGTYVKSGTLWPLPSHPYDRPFRSPSRPSTTARLPVRCGRLLHLSPYSPTHQPSCNGSSVAESGECSLFGRGQRLDAGGSVATSWERLRRGRANGKSSSPAHRGHDRARKCP
jgi:hypothetical protein